MGQNRFDDSLPIDDHAEALAQIQDLRKQLHMIKKSFSWRITAPLRLVVSVLIQIINLLIYVPLKIIGPRLDQYPDFTHQVIHNTKPAAKKNQKNVNVARCVTASRSGCRLHAQATCDRWPAS